MECVGDDDEEEEDDDDEEEGALIGFILPGCFLSSTTGETAAVQVWFWSTVRIAPLRAEKFLTVLFWCYNLLHVCFVHVQRLNLY